MDGDADAGDAPAGRCTSRNAALRGSHQAVDVGLRVVSWQVPPLSSIMCVINSTTCGPTTPTANTAVVAEAISHFQQSTWLQSSFDAAHLQ